MAAGFVAPLAHGPIFGDVFGRGERQVFIEQTLRRRVRRVGHERGVPDEERLLLGDRAVDEVVNRLHGLAADGEAGVAVARSLGHAVGEAAPFEIAFPPLAGLEAGVAFGSKEARQRRRGVDMGDLPFTQAVEFRIRAGLLGFSFALARGRRERRVVREDLVLVRVQAGENRREARSAEARRHVAAREGERFGGQPIEPGRLDLLVTHEAEIAVGLIVGDDQHDVRPLGGGEYV